ncbi:MAG: PD40 domain-containing protein [Saprospiraceae bacterium]|nr:PD40 domain-containing protein [Saprospiraceae bacterium]
MIQILTMPCVVFSQKSQLKQGDIYFEAGKYAEAIQSYNNYKKINKKPDALIKRGFAYLKTNNPDACIADMASAHTLKSLDVKRFKYSAQAYFAKGDYQEAARFYKTYLNTLKSNDVDWESTVNEIKRCGYAKNKKYSAQLAFVENLGGNVNTVFDEIAPKQSPTKVGRYYFSSARSESTGGLRDKNGLADVIKGTYCSDMYYVDLQEGNWSTVLPMDALLNSPKEDILQDFSVDGSIIYYLKRTGQGASSLYTDTFKLEKNIEILPVSVSLGHFNPENGDRDLHFFNDSLMIFSSARAGGYGKYDLYYSVYQNGFWHDVNNLGPEVNTPEDEVSPYLLKNGTTLFFSSDRLKTLGGFDIFSAEYTSGTWQVSNLFAPINSPMDDREMEISADGNSAVFSSNRLASKGGFDIYIAYFKEQLFGQMNFVEMPGFVLGHNELFAINDSLSTKEVVQENKPVEITPLPEKEFVTGPLYFQGDEDVLNNQNLNSIRRIADLMLVYPEARLLLQSHYIAEVLAAPVINGINSTLAEKINKRIDIDFIKDGRAPIKVLYDKPTVAEQFRDTKWDIFNDQNQGVTFRIKFAQVVQMLKSDVLGVLPDIIMEKTAGDSNYSYTSGNYLTLADAEDAVEKMKALNLLDVEILPYYQGKKSTEEEAAHLSVSYPQYQLWLENIKNKARNNLLRTLLSS